MRSLWELLLYLWDSLKVLVTKTFNGLGFGLFGTIIDTIELSSMWIQKGVHAFLESLSLWFLQLGFTLLFAVILVFISYPTVYIFFEFVGWPNDRWWVADNYLYWIRVVFNSVVQWFHKDIVGEAPTLTPDLSLAMYKKLLSPKDYRLCLLLTVIICWWFTIWFYGNIFIGIVWVTISCWCFGKDFEDAIAAVRLENKNKHLEERQLLKDAQKVYNKVFKVDHYKISDEEKKNESNTNKDADQEKSNTNKDANQEMPKKTENDDKTSK